jgi:hypothetical protein
MEWPWEVPPLPRRRFHHFLSFGSLSLPPLVAMPVVVASRTFRPGNLPPVSAVAKGFCTFVLHLQHPAEPAMGAPVVPASRPHTLDPHSVEEVEVEAAERALLPFGPGTPLVEEAEAEAVLTLQLPKPPEQRSYDRTH